MSSNIAILYRLYRLINYLDLTAYSWKSAALRQSLIISFIFQFEVNSLVQILIACSLLQQRVRLAFFRSLSLEI